MNKLCECGCGKETKIGRDSRQYNRFIKGHQIRILETQLKIIQSGKIIRKDGKFNPNFGKKRSLEAIQKVSKANIGRKHTIEELLKMSRAAIENKRRLGKKHSEETKHKMSLSAIKYLENNNYSPRRGKNENSIIDKIQNIFPNEEILRNDFRIAHITGKFPDGYFSKYNLSIDILESWHFKSNGELKEYDKKRQLIIAYKLSCMIYYIPEQEFLSNSEKEIQRFKDFLLLLDEGKN